MSNVDLFSLRRTPFHVRVDAAPEVVLDRLAASAERGGPFELKTSGRDRVRVQPRTHDLVPVFQGQVRDDDAGSIVDGSIGPDGFMIAWRAVCLSLILGVLVLLLAVVGLVATALTAAVLVVAVPALVRFRAGPQLATRARHPTRIDTFAADLESVVTGRPT